MILAPLLVSTSASAHEARPGFLELEQVDAETFEQVWKVPAKGPNAVLGLHVRLPSDVTLVSAPVSEFTGGAIVERSTIRHPGGLVGAEIYIEGLSTTLTDVLVRIARLDGSTQVVLLRPDSPSFVVAASPTFLDVGKTYLVLGIQHIWEGVDHLLFVACLILIAGSWRRILVTVTGFTAAHSITLGLAAMDVVRVPIAPVEACIALSIVFLATEIARERRDTLTWRYPITVSASFGLLHGFGFASALGQIGLPQTEIPAALLFFNLGVEVGQIVFVSAILLAVGAVTLVLRRRGKGLAPWYRRLERPMAYGVGALAALWTAERIVSFWN